MKTVCVFGAFDSKGYENKYLLECLDKLNVKTISVDLGTQSDPPFTADYPQDVVAKAGGGELAPMRAGKVQRSDCLATMAAGGAAIVSKLVAEGKVDGVMAMGGGQGTFLASEVLKKMPIGLPKLLISTIVGSDGTERYFATAYDTMLVNSVVDVSGLNSVMKCIIGKAAGAMVGMIDSGAYSHMAPEPGKKRVAISMWGVTTPCVDRIREDLLNRGYDVYVFHANGIGGRTMEALIDQKFFDAVIDITVSELTNGMIPGHTRIIEERLKNAVKNGVPYIVSVGGVDMIQAHIAKGPLPEFLKNRQEYWHNPTVLFVRSNAEENKQFADAICERLNNATAVTKVILPLKGTSASDKEGGPLYNPDIDRVLFDEIKAKIRSDIEVVEVNNHINDPEFADAAADLLEVVLKEQAEKNKK